MLLILLFETREKRLDAITFPQGVPRPSRIDRFLRSVLAVFCELELDRNRE
jgi:hypothetical protein